MHVRIRSMNSLDIIAPLLTEKVRRLTIERLTTRRNFFRGERLDVDASKEEVKIALIALRKVNELENLSAEEEALLRGITRRSLSNTRGVNS